MKPRTSPEQRVVDVITQNIAEESAAAAKNDKAESKNNSKMRYSGLISKQLWQQFSIINDAKSVPNNAMINLLIAQFVEANKQYLTQ